MPHSRRDVLKLSLLATPALFAACTSSERKGNLPLPSSTSKPHPLGLGESRDGFLYVPARQDPSQRVPVLLYLHGAGGSGERGIQHLIAHADRTGTIVIAPDSRTQTWDMVTGEETGDVEFLNDALREVLDAYPVDKAHIGIAGFSDGASAALSWGLVKGDLFSAIAAFSPGFIRLSSRPKGRPKVFVSHGVHDQILPIDRCGRKVVRDLRKAGYEVEYKEFDGDHTVPAAIRDAGLASLVG